MRPMYLSFLTVITVVVAFLTCASAQVNGAGQEPYLGWSSFSQQTIQGNFLTQANMITQSDALKASGLQDHGFVYINLDSGWQGSFDQNGRPIPNSATFADVKAMVDHIHANGQKAGIYWIPGIEQPAVDGNYPILGTPYHTQDQDIVVLPLAKGNAFAANPPNPYHDKIDFTKPGAQEYIDSVVALSSSWGPRRRTRVATIRGQLVRVAQRWEHETSTTLGWNDMDTLDVGDGTLDGLSDVEKQTAITIWALANSPTGAASRF
jgi:alpha-galactosidase